MTFYRSAVGATDAHKEALEIQNRALTTGAQIFLGLAVLAGAYLTFRRVRAVEKQAEAAHQGQLTERFTRAIEQLGDERASVCLGGIYALERISRDSPRDHPQVMEVLCAFVREQTRPTDPTAAETNARSAEPPSTVVQAALAVIGRNPLSRTQALRHLDLRRIRVPGADLSGADFSGVKLREAQLNGSKLYGALLQDADLFKASLREAVLSKANLTAGHLRSAELQKAVLSGAVLCDADLSAATLCRAVLFGTDLSRADLRGADLNGADLSEADLSGANLSNAWNLTHKQLQVAQLDEHTQLPEGLQKKEGGEEPRLHAEPEKPKP